MPGSPGGLESFLPPSYIAANNPGRKAISTCRSTFLLLALSLLAVAFCFPQDGNRTVPPHVHYPLPLAPGEWQKSIGLAVTTLPKDIVEEEMNQSPAVDFNSSLGLPWNFSLDGRAIVQVLTNHLSLGVRWSHAFDRFAFSFGDDVAWWFGFLTLEGFDNRADGWLNYPHVSIGYDFGNFRMSARAEAVLVMAYSSFAGDNNVATDKNSFGGFSFSVVIEQPFWKNTHVSLGFKASYLRFFYQSWFVFETFRRYLFIPEISVGFIL